MKLSQPITLQPPKYTNEHNQEIVPSPITTDELHITYCDSPSQKRYYAHIQNLDHYGTLFLFDGEAYDAASPISSEFAEGYVRGMMGTNPQKFLQNMYPRTLDDDPNGPGSILSGMLSTIGIKSSENCSCRRHAIEMNKNGPDWCENNIDTILSWLREESEKRKLPFIESIAKMLVKRAIAMSRKLLQKDQLISS